mmetsp:Transcript_136250/g.240821  ORF Transcript_136250/g.240821 Transcript_136250/m.240821 type:complete len:216 (-) Transcript_136250:246-893(-)
MDCKSSLISAFCMKTSMQGGHRLSCRAGNGFCKTVQLTAIRPPGLSTLYTSRNAFGLDGQRQNAPFEMTASTEDPSKGKFSTSPCTKLHLLKPRSRALFSARTTSSADKSTPMVRPSGPTFSAARKESIPNPLPKSKTVSPALRVTALNGLPTPCMRSTSSPMKASSSSEYPNRDIKKRATLSRISRSPSGSAWSALMLSFLRATLATDLSAALL